MRVLIFLAVLGAALAVPAHKTDRIVGGSETTIDNYPFMANMQFSYAGVSWNHLCSGTLITSRSILSTAHCYYGSLVPMWRALLGTSYAASGGDEHTISTITIHEDYDYDMHTNDIVIVVLASAATFSVNVGVANIAGTNYILPDSTSVTAIGWGRIESAGEFPEVLQYVNLNVINQETCAQRYADLKTQPGFSHYPDVSTDMICTGIHGVAGYGTCERDNGGPVLHNNNVVVGLIAWRYGCGLAEYPGVNTKVSSYTEWIVANASV